MSSFSLDSKEKCHQRHMAHTPLNCAALVNPADAFMCHGKSRPTVSWIQEIVTGPKGAATVLPSHSLSPSNYVF